MTNIRVCIFYALNFFLFLFFQVFFLSAKEKLLNIGEFGDWRMFDGVYVGLTNLTVFA